MQEPFEVSLFRAHHRVAMAASNVRPFGRGLAVSLPAILALLFTLSCVSLHWTFVGPNCYSNNSTCFNETTVASLKDLSANQTWLLTVVVPERLITQDGMAVDGVWEFTPKVRAVLNLRSTPFDFNLFRADMTIQNCSVMQSAELEYFGSYDVVLYNDFLRQFGGGFAMDSLGIIADLNAFKPDTVEAWILDKSLIFLLAYLIQWGLMGSAELAFLVSQSQLLRLRPTPRELFLHGAPVLFGFFLCLFGSMLFVDLILEEKLLSLMFVFIAWFCHMFKFVYLRLNLCVALFHGVSKHLFRILVIYCIRFGPAGFRFEVCLATGTILFALGVALFLLREVPAIVSGQINVAQVRENMLIRRMEVRINQHQHHHQ